MELITLLSLCCVLIFFFFQAEDGIRDHCVTGVQTCALPICRVIPPREPRRQGPSVSALYRQVFLALKHMARRQNFVLPKDYAAPRTTPPAVHPHNRRGDVFHRVSHTVRQGGQSIRVFHSLLLILLVNTDTLSSGY